ncbi:unnamed protein product [Staurois parvus]|uniref:Uncharacterized protein n=1 Tax=Staurois parvus TaxID=386267 RepID=A0ABN9CIZ9_9NEOB|nr:unnamed protein product [Staurois parvus]
MVGMDLEQTGTRSRPLSTPASDRGIRQRYVQRDPPEVCAGTAGSVQDGWMAE